MKFCSKCGSELSDEAIACPKCGSPTEAYVNSRSNGMAIAGFIFSFLIPLFGWIFGGIGLKRSKELNGKGRGLSIAAIVISTLDVLVSIIVVIATVING